MREQLLLELRNAVADKEWCIAGANMETARNGAWTCDWRSGFGDSDIKIEFILTNLNSLSKQ